MRTTSLYTFLFAALVCLAFSSRANGQGAYGYASIDIDPSTHIATGYASTELDYQTAAYYNAEVQAYIENEYGTVLASASTTGVQTATVVFSASNIIQCIIHRIRVYTILNAIIFDDCGYVDPFGFGYLPFDIWWDYGYWWNDRWLCRFESFIRIAEIIETVVDCVTANVTCEPSTLQVLPAGLTQAEKNSINNPAPAVPDTATFTCHAFDNLGQPVSNIAFSFTVNTNNVAHDGGHQNHTGARPPGAFNHANLRTDGSGQVSSVFTPDRFGGSSNIVITSNGTTIVNTPVFILVPGLEALQPAQANDAYVLTGSAEDGNNYHPNGHYAKPQANNGLRQIAATYQSTFFPAANFPNGVPQGDRLRFNDASLVFGGVFDITPNFRQGAAPSWQLRPHDEHHVGINCDLSDRNIPNNQVMVNGVLRNRWQVMEEIFCANGSTRTNREHCRHHWHLRFEFGQNGCHETEGCYEGAAGSSIPADGVAVAIPGVIQVEAYDKSDEDTGSFVPDDGNGPADGIYYNYPQVLWMPGNVNNSYVPTIGGQWMNYTVNIASAGTYTISANVGSPFSGNTFHIEQDGVNITGPIAIPNTGSFDAYQVVSINNISLAAGQHVLGLYLDGFLQATGNFDYLSINPYQVPPACHPSSAQLNACYRHGGDWDYDLCYCVY
ncbi:MAG TPA: carbohydrate-binding protein [Pyrinomonadaceae bacterium]